MTRKIWQSILKEKQFELVLRRMLQPWDHWGLPSSESRGFVPVMWVVRVKFWVHHTAATVECAVTTMKVWWKAPPFSHWCYWCEQKPLFPTTVLVFFHLECSGLLYNLVIQMDLVNGPNIFILFLNYLLLTYLLSIFIDRIFSIFSYLVLCVYQDRLGDLSYFNI